MQCFREAGNMASGGCAPIKREPENCQMRIRKPDTDMYLGLQKLPPAMAYVPEQMLSQTFSLDYALQVGTIFPELCKPFCGKRGMKR
jgi:hypothetical protein